MAIIEVKGLGKRYKGNDFYSLKNANFTIEEGDIVGLVGKNGSGKSTLLKLLAKSQDPTEGNIWGDYYYLEALIRFYKDWELYW